MATGQLCKIDACGKPKVSRGYCDPHYKRFRIYGDPLGGGTVRGAPAEWLRTAAKYQGEDCLIWPFACDREGRARVVFPGMKTKWASRVICHLAHGPAPTPRHEAAHSCGRGHEGCVSPMHLRWATTKENHADRREHGTHPEGEDHGSAKLTAAEVLEIRRLAEAGTVHRAIAETYGITISHVRAIKRRQTWAHLEDAR